MSETTKIIRNSKLSVDRPDVERSLSFDVSNTVSQLNGLDIKSTLDVNEQYIKERDNCNDYRLIITIKPYCTNVLFNTCTEVVMAEGSDNADAVLLDDGIDTDTLKVIKPKIKGKNRNVKIYDMIRNTEYSREGIGFEYHPGLDIFNNHILRNRTYRIVNDYNSSKNNRDIFNTIEDYMRASNGEVLKRCCRKNITDTNMVNKHLYDKDDILPFYTGEAISENLREQDGWFGFYNTSVISAKNIAGIDMDISRVINSKGNCEFIDMYPDRTLYSFTPKYNKYRNRYEYNWEYAITYAFDSTTSYTYTTKDKNSQDICLEKDFEIVKSGDVNALITIGVEYATLPNGNNVIFFRSATKHNLKPQDSVYIYFNEDEENGNWHKSGHAYTVAGVGDINHNYQDYYFYISNLDLLEEIFCTPYLCDTIIENDYLRYLNTDILHNGDIYYTIERGEYVRHFVSGVSIDGISVEDFKLLERGLDVVYKRPVTPWDYVRDYFYDTYSPNQIKLFNEDKSYIKGELTARLENNSRVVYITNKDHTGEWSEADFDTFDNSNFIKYPDTGLTNIPTEGDKYIMVDGTKYILCNHDRDIIYDGSTDCNVFIKAIINNAFTRIDEYDSDSEVNDSMNGLYSDYISVRFVKTNGNYDCSYYIRKFKQISGLNGDTLSKESYPLAFSDTIYGDKVTQNVFTDNINVVGLKDNLGRDLTEVFLTIVKTNKGYKKWYGIDNGNDANVFNDPDIEYSHCFGAVTCGFDLFSKIDDSADIRKTREDLIDIKMIYPGADGERTIPNCTLKYILFAVGDIITEGSKYYTKNDNIYTEHIQTDGNRVVEEGEELYYQVGDNFDTEDIKITDDWFYGDIVEFCPWTCEETTISDVCFRFNTAQRDLLEPNDFNFKFDEIASDDYDDDGFNICTYRVSNGVSRPEGYYYKAHYRIPLRDLTSVIQGSHSYINVRNAMPVQVDDIEILVTCGLKHKLNSDSKVLLRDTVSSNTPEWWLDVVYIVDDYRFVMKKIDKSDNNYVDWVAICHHLNNNEYTLRAKNPNIPDKASRLGVNTYLWREAVKTIDLANTESEVNKYVFANNALYVDTCFNFYLKRQDPYNVNGLYFDGSSTTITLENSTGDSCVDLSKVDKTFVGDIESKSYTQESNFEYKDEEYTAQC